MNDALRLRTAAIALAAFLAIGAPAFSFFIYQSALGVAQRGAGAELAAIARAAAAGYDGDAVRALFLADVESPAEFQERLAAAPARPEFDRLRNQLKRHIAAQQAIGFNESNLYFFVIDPFQDSQVRWGVMAHARAFTGEPYAQRPEMRDITAGRVASRFTAVYLSTASRREWMSGYAAVRDSRGRIVGVMEAALDVESVRALAQAEARGAFAVIGGVIGLALLTGFGLFRFMVSLKEANERLGATVERLNLNNANMKLLNEDLKLAREKASASERRYRRLLEGSRDFVFSLDAELKFLSANGAIRSVLGIGADRAYGRTLLEALQQAGAELEEIEYEILRERLKELGEKQPFFEMLIDIRVAAIQELRSYRFRFDWIAGESGQGEILGKAEQQDEDALMAHFQAEKQAYRIDNQFLLAEDAASRVTRNLKRFAEPGAAAAVRIAIREALFNAIEHGNLGLSFAEKSQAMAEDRYLELVRARRSAPEYSSRRVTIASVLNRREFAVRITDEGAGFDHRKRLDPDKLNDGLEQHGRGLLMIRAAFDEVRYNERGNELTLIKRFALSAESAGTADSERQMEFRESTGSYEGADR